MLPEELEDAIAAEAGDADPRALARAAEEISAWYRAGLPAAMTPRWDDARRVAYAATRMPATLAAVTAALEEAAARLPEAAVRSHLDLCAGPGTAVWAADAALPGITAVTCVERDPGFAELGARLLARARGDTGPRVTWAVADLARPAELPRHDLVTIGYGLNELASADRNALLDAAWRAAQTALVVVEPGTPAGSAIVQDCRARLIAAGAKIAAPCPHAHPCPLAGRQDRWCHFSRRLARSRMHRAAKGGDLGYEDERFSYVVASRAVPVPFDARIIGHPHARNAGVDLELCRADGIERLLAPKRDREAHRRARRARWGDEWRCG
jgi:ribosomal protein RSM22 (predicted rRNA methylase)